MLAAPRSQGRWNVLAYVVRRLGVLVVILFGSSFLLYNLAAFSGDPLEGLRLSSDPNAQQLIITLTRDLNLDVPPPLRYFLWLQGILTGDFGMTRDAQSVMSALVLAIPTTVRLVFGATIVAIVLGISVGIITALRQYSRFDYSMTFVAFLLFSLPIFWVAVLLKQYMAINFNTFLESPSVSWTFAMGAGVVAAIFWGSILGRDRRTFWIAFVGAGVLSTLLLKALDWANYFLDPGLGVVGVVIVGTLIAFGITQLSTGISNRPSLYSALSMVALGAIAYFPAQAGFNSNNPVRYLLLMAVITIALASVVPLAFSRIDRGPMVRTSVITAVLVGGLIILDRLMQTWKPYMQTDAIFFRPIPTTGQRNPLLETTDFWMNLLDTLVHMILPTVALTLISFAGYIRYSRGTLLEVLNQDYIRTARAKGLNERTVIMRHAFRNTMIPLTTIMVVDFAGIIGGAIITERVFGWRGMGTLFDQAINSFDLNLLMGVFLITGFLAVFANLVADLLYSALDPRIRVGAGS